MRLLMQGGFLFGGQVALSAFGVEEKQKDDRAISQVEVDHPRSCSISAASTLISTDCTLTRSGSFQPHILASIRLA
jgi:hypothetical protein